jgi:hypothetical protein
MTEIFKGNSSEGQVTNEPLTKSDLVETVDGLENTISKLTSPMWTLMVGIIIVLFLGFVSVLIAMQALVVESNHFKTTEVERLNEKVDRIGAIATETVSRVPNLGDETNAVRAVEGIPVWGSGGEYYITRKVTK